MDVNWYVAEAMARQHLADLRASVARHCPPLPAESSARSWGSPLGLAAIRLSHRLVGGLGAVRALTWKRLP